MKLIQCNESHLRGVTDFYHKAVAYLQTHINYPVWSSEHPSDESIKEAIRRGEQYICMEGDAIIGALLLSEFPDGDYEAGNWSRDLKEGEYLSVHVLAVSADCYQRGVGSFMVRECIAIARAKGYKAVRLDIVPSNTPAERLYKKNGFVYAGTVDLNRPTAPIPLFDLYELNFD